MPAEPQEKVLRGLPGVSRIVSKAQRGQGEVSIEFLVGHDLRRGLIEALNRLDRVPRYSHRSSEGFRTLAGCRVPHLAPGTGEGLVRFRD